MAKKTLLMFFVLALSLPTLSAEDYQFESYALEVAVRLDNSYAIQEHIVADFSSPRHGIFREIPVLFGRQRVKLTNLEANVPIIKDSVSSGYVTFRLGSEDRTVTGIQEYQIRYDYAIGDDRNDEYDEFYFNIVGVGWQAPIDHVSFTVNFPKPIDPSMVFLTGGVYGTTAQRGSFVISADGKTITGEAEELYPGEALTLRVQMEEGYYSDVRPFIDFTVPSSIIALLVAFAASVHATILFRRYGKEELFVPVVRFDPPEDLSPMQVGYLVDGVVDNKDLTSMIFYWADQGCLTISELDKKEFIFTKIKEPPTIKEHEKHLFSALFACGDGTEVTLKQLEKSSFSKDLEKAKTEVRAYFKGERELKDGKAERKRIAAMLYGALSVVLMAIASTISYIGSETVVFLVVGFFSLGTFALVASRLDAIWETSSTFKKGFKFFLLGVSALFLFVLAFLFMNPVFGHGTFYSLVMAFSLVAFPGYLGFLAIVTGKRSAYAQKKLEEIVGYREFISKVEMDKLKMMIDSDPSLFYHVLSYAIVLGLEDVWAKKFAKIALAEPQWYVGNRPIRNALFYSALSHRMHTSVMENAVYAQAKSGSRSPIRSSFGSGGFSGGGFGGGGGGAW
ncbi:DUF2207 domain-containing protein [Sphaerochaeta sp.]|jgi:uncharacterized membrane protein YgcG|uniref:DUF2207 domain-containing protein n=1 Tax=Sphaerochaeta sp. TaxID=1972642 RepID=UPI003D0F9C51